MGDSKIEWTNKVWNPIRGCTKVSEGCRNCYAERMAARFAGPGAPFEGVIKNGRWNGHIDVRPEKVGDPFQWRKPARVFVNSMSDLFHSGVKDETIKTLFGIMLDAPKHTFQVLTKRPARMASNLSQEWWAGASPEARKHIWLGVSVENQKAAAERIPLLRQTPAAVRWVSAEPLLENLKGIDLDGIHWVVGGGESGPGARPCHPQWARNLRDRCQEQGVRFFWKRWGAWGTAGAWNKMCEETGRESYDWRAGQMSTVQFVPSTSPTCDEVMFRVGKKYSGRLLDGREWNEYP